MGKKLLHFNLTSICNTYDGNTFTFTIHLDETVHNVILYELTSTYKPVVVEVRAIVYEKTN